MSKERKVSFMLQRFRQEPDRVRRILVCQLRQLGDVLLATPAIELLRKRFPAAQIHVFTESKCVPLLEGNPYIHTVWGFSKKEAATLWQEVPFYWRVARQGYDIVVDFQQLPRCRWVVAFSGAPVRLSYTPSWYNAWLYTDWQRPLEGYAGKAKASVLAPLGIEWAGERPRLYLSEAELEQARCMLAALGLEQGQRLITVDATHRRATRCWPAQQYAALLSLIAEADASVRFLVVYGPGEEAIVRALAQSCRYPERVFVAASMQSLREMAACIALADMHLGNCSAPRHVAVAVDTPSFAILGSTSESWTFPAPEHRSMAFGKACQPCNANTCRFGEAIPCLSELSPDQVFSVFYEHWQAHGKE